MQSGTRDVFSCSAINLCISSETDNVVTLGEYRRTVWLPRCWWRRERRRGRSARRPGGPRRGRRVVPANLLREKEGGGRGGKRVDRLFTLRCCRSQISLSLVY